MAKSGFGLPPPTGYVRRNELRSTWNGMTDVGDSNAQQRDGALLEAADEASAVDLLEYGDALAPAQDDHAVGLQGWRRTISIACTLGTLVLVVLDAAIANVALPTIAQSLHVNPAEAVRVITAYQMALVMALLPAAALGESLGHRRVFVAGVALFTAASALCAVAPSLDWLVVARFIQGFGGAAIMAIGIALVRDTVAHHQLAAAIGWNALTGALSNAAGPTIGALILSFASWPWLFAVNLPIGVAALAASGALPYIAGTARRIDLISVVLNAIGFAALVIGAELVPTDPKLAVAAFAISAVGFVALVRREMPVEAPLIPLDLLRVSSFRVSVIASVMCFAGQSVAMVALPFYLQHELHQSTLATGLFITPWPLTVALMAPLASRLTSRVPTGWLCAVGGAVLAVGLTTAALWPFHGSALPLIPIICVCGIGFGLFQVPNNHNMFMSAPRARSGAAGGMQGTARLSGQTTGAVIMTLLFALTSIGTAPKIGLGIGAALALGAGLVSVLRAGRKAP